MAGDDREDRQMANALDVDKRERAVKSVYEDVAEDPDEEDHCGMGRDLAERLGYPPERPDQIPAEAVEPFAGVGYYFDRAGIEEGASNACEKDGVTGISLGATK